MRFIALIIFFLIGLTNIVLASDNVGKLDFEKLFYGDIIDPQNHIKPIGMALIGDFSGAILENDKNEQFFIMEGDEINLENQIFHIKSISPDGIVLRSKLEKETILRFPDQKKIIEKKVVGDWKNPQLPVIDLETYKRLAKSLGAPDFFINAIKTPPVTTRSRAGRLGILVSENLPILLLKQLGLRPNDIILEIQKIPVLETERLFSEITPDSLSEVLLEVQRDDKLRIIRITQ
jgi:hypothetical protein|tara:strand:- start:20 stop:721 length:702 start_codon:yes stop_codon:yes gene_type:complete